MYNQITFLHIHCIAWSTLTPVINGAESVHSLETICLANIRTPADRNITNILLLKNLSFLRVEAVTSDSTTKIQSN